VRTTTILAAALLGLALPAWGAPTVSMTAPINGNLYLSPGTFAVKANASAPGVGVNRVEFYANGNLIHTDTTSPYQFDWTGVAVGTYAITAKAVDNNGAETTSAPRSVTVAGINTAPTVSLTEPADNARYLNPSGVTFSANASGPELNDILQKVEFFLNGSLAGTVTAAPWTFSLPGPTLGTHVLTAVATDSQGATTTSAPRTIVVSDTNLAPTVSIVTPLDNSNWHAPAGFMFQASANSGEANDTVAVEFYVNGVLQGTDSTSPYSINLSSLATGTYTLMAKAIDGQNTQTSTVTRTITVSDTNVAPIVTITAPSGGTNYPTAPAGFTITTTANAGEVNGWITRVDFYVNGSLVNTDTAGPWSYPVSGLANGTYQLTAKAVDQLGGETTSTPITVTVGPQAKGYFIHVDHLNTPRLVADATGTTVWRWDQQEPFGNNVPDENPSSLGVFDLPLRLPGQYFDKETSLHYNYYRDFDPGLGSYKESDPIGLRGGLNTYVYVSSNPLKAIDPVGLCACKRGTWDQEVGDWTLSLGFGGYFSTGKVTYTCRSNPSIKCTGRQTCIGGGAMLIGGVSWSIAGTAYGAPTSRSLSGWSGSSLTGQVGLGVLGGGTQAPIGAPGGSAGVGVGVGGGVAYINCYTDRLNCVNCPNCD
jgi:RHS repeat-associated protein